MKRQQARPTNDPVLTPFLDSPDDTGARLILGELLCGNAESVIKEVVRYKFRKPVGSGSVADGADVEDACSEVLARLVAKLWELRANPDATPIIDFRSYVAGISYNACDDYFRRKFPRRHSLKARLRYLLNKKSPFALWKTSDRCWVCGFEIWREQYSMAYSGSGPKLFQPDSSLETRDDVEAYDESWNNGAESTELGRVVNSIFVARGRPMEFDDLVDAVAETLGIRDHVEHADEFTQTRDAGFTSADDLDLREQLQIIWTELCELPVSQRTALLLNLRGGGDQNLISLFPLTNIATMRQIAEALEMPAEQLATLWNELPLDDLKIAGLLRVSRQKVINMRKSARRRLARRARV